jgi:hypothetical protein
MPPSDPIEIPDGVPEDAVDALYGLPLDEFTPRRDELSRELRGAGKRDEAAWVKALKKPSATAWLVNQLARTQTSDARRMLEGGDALRAAQERALSGKGGRDELAAAAEEHASAMRALMSKAPGLLDRQGASPSATTLERAGETLRAIPLDDEARAGFAAGRLTREHRAAGLGFAATGAPHKPAPTKSKPAKAATAAKPGKTKKDEDKEAERRAKEREQARDVAKKARALQRLRQREASELQRRLSQAQRELERAQGRLDKAEAAVERGRQRVAEAAARAEEAEAAAKRT